MMTPTTFAFSDWLDRYQSERPPSALGYFTPKEFSERIAA